MAAGCLWMPPADAVALIGPSTTVDGPSAAITEFGGAAMAPDGTGGVVYSKVDEGVPHVFAARYVGGHWSAPIRVDAEDPFEASWPRITAGPDGRLLVIWVTPRARVHGRLRYGLMSARLGPQAKEFSHSILVDSNVGAGNAVSPSLSGTAPGEAVVAYRVITNDFTFVNRTIENEEDVQLRPGDVLADIRVARLNGGRWSVMGNVNRNPLASMRAPSELNAPEIGAAKQGGAVIAWQEPETNGVARIWARRVFASSLGPVLPVSPPSWQGTPVSEDIDAFSLAVSPLGSAVVAMRVAGSQPFGAPRLLANVLPGSSNTEAVTFTGAAFADGLGSPPPAPLGPPAVAIADQGKEATIGIGYSAGGQARMLGGKAGSLGGATALGTAAGGDGVSVAVGATGGEVVAWPGQDVVAVRQDFPSGASQSAVISSSHGGPVADAELGGSESSTAMLGFRQGEAGRFAIVADPITSPPASLAVRAPKGWVKPRRARIAWSQAAATSVVSYEVLLDGRTVGEGLHQLSLRPLPRLLDNGRHSVQVVATDSQGQQFVSSETRLRIDTRPPEFTAHAGKHHSVAVRVTDPESGVVGHATHCRFGDGSTAHGRRSFRHRYDRPGRHRIAVSSRDRAGNAVHLRLWVRVR